MKVIKEKHTDEETALVVEDYPYGFSQRTKIRYWVETVKKRGDRFVSQTLNPKTQLWNKPKKSTYFSVAVMGLKENGHVTYKAIYPSTSKEDYDKFMNGLEDYEFNELQNSQLRVLRAYIKAYENVTFECSVRRWKHKITGDIYTNIPIMEINDFVEIDKEGKEINREEEDKKQEEIKTTINKLVAYNYHKDEGKN